MGITDYTNQPSLIQWNHNFGFSQNLFYETNKKILCSIILSNFTSNPDRFTFGVRHPTRKLPVNYW